MLGEFINPAKIHLGVERLRITTDKQKRLKHDTKRIPLRLPLNHKLIKQIGQQKEPNPTSNKTKPTKPLMPHINPPNNKIIIIIKSSQITQTSSQTVIYLTD